MEIKLTPTEILDKIIATVEGDTRLANSGGTWDREVRHVGIPTIATYVLSGDFKLGKGQATYTNDLIELPEDSGIEDVMTTREGKTVAFRHVIGMHALHADADSPLAQLPALKSGDLVTLRAEMRRTEEMATLRLRVAALEAENADLQASLDALTVAVGDEDDGKPVTVTPKPAPKTARATK
ncbi:hypothetical protein ACIBKY_51090 [Nonomuraea sp. NPDC050394]|uniref:hypothetical protein n=1 Tax=Nonomuraea sp. NPDC050394 TaxID=3364363 RepID=UPI0037A32978